MLLQELIESRYDPWCLEMAHSDDHDPWMAPAKPVQGTEIRVVGENHAGAPLGSGEQVSIGFRTNLAP